jgi:hypothetical protein
MAGLVRFSDGFSPRQAKALADCVDHYAQAWLDQWLFKKRSLNEDTWTRDLVTLAAVFQVEHRFSFAREQACQIVTDAYAKRPIEGMVPFSADEINALTVEHAELLDQLHAIVCESDRKQ